MQEQTMMERLKRTVATWLYAFAVMACLLVTGITHAQERYVTVNNQRLSDVEVATLDRMVCSFIPNGNYWVNANTGAWGYAGNPFPQGRIGEHCSTAQPRRKSLSERGMLFSSRDWTR